MNADVVLAKTWTTRTVAASVMLLVLTLAVLAAYLGESSGAPLYMAFHGLCHQQHERCFHFFGMPMAICIRCTAIYSGILFGATLMPFLSEKNRMFLVGMLITASLLVGLDVAAEAIGLYHDVAAMRLFTGGVLGISISPFFITALRDLLTATPTHRHSP
ncbi:MAG: DUF2085 domain-containing protein [Rhizobacter sp.]|nr:DUF2085 domain-containing protein [Chlorobiales bacterium]